MPSDLRNSKGYELNFFAVRRCFSPRGGLKCIPPNHFYLYIYTVYNTVPLKCNVALARMS